MLLTLQGLNLPALQCTLENKEGGETSLQLADLTGLKGVVEQSKKQIALRSLMAESLRLGLSVPLSGGHLSFQPETYLSGVRADLLLPGGSEAPSFSGAVYLSTLQAPRLSLDISGVKLSCDLDGKDATFEQSPQGGRVHLREVTLRDIALQIGDLTIRASSLEGKELRASWGKDPLTVELASATASEVSVEDQLFTVTVDALSLSERLFAKGSEVSVGQLDGGKVSVSVRLAKDPPDPGGAGEGGGGPDQREPSDASGGGDVAARAPFPIDLRLLDGLFGRAHVDLAMDARLPVIGLRQAVHRFRIPIQSGIINYKELEKNLSSLEDAFLDFKVYQGKLAVVFDIPLVPDKPKPIVTWDLDQEGLALAKRLLVRLRTLPNLRLAKSDEKDKKGGAAFDLRRLAFEGVDVDLELRPPDTAAPEAKEGFSGLLSRAVVGRLRVKGRVEHKPGAAPAPTLLSLAAQSLAASLRGLPLGTRSLDLDIEIGALEEGDLSFLGMQPETLRSVLSGVKIREALLKGFSPATERS